MHCAVRTNLSWPNARGDSCKGDDGSMLAAAGSCYVTAGRQVGSDVSAGESHQECYHNNR